MNNSTIKPSEQCKTAGLKSLTELSTISGVSAQTLINWHKEKPHLFDVVLAGSIVKKQKKHISDIPGYSGVILHSGNVPIPDIQGYPVQLGNISNGNSTEE